MVSQPKYPDPKETAAAQAGMNRETAITQQNLNMIDQDTPYGTLTYSQNGNNFAPSETGQNYFFNKATGEYRTDSPAIKGYVTTTTPGEKGSITGGQNGRTVADKPATTTDTPIYEDGWEQVKGILTPKYKATTTLDPVQQAILDQTNGAGLNLATLANDRSAFLKQYLGQNIDMSGLPALQGSIGNGFSGDIGGSFSTEFGPGFKTDFGSDYRTKIGGNYSSDLGSDYQTSYAGADDFSADRQRVVDALKERARPDQQAQARDLETQLIGRGLRPGTAAWNSEMDRLSRSNNDFALAADLAGGQEQSRLVGLSRDAADFANSSILNRAGFQNQSELARFMAENGAITDQARFGNEAIANRFAAQNAASLAAAGFRNDAALTGANFNNAARGQGLQELYAARNQPINEISALLGSSQVQNPNFINTPSASVGGVDYAGLVSDKYKADSARSQAAMGGLFGLLSSGIGLLSDRRTKTDVRRVGALENGLSVYSFRYRGDDATQIGLMADEVEQIHPEAVAVGKDGFKRVRYDIAVEAA